MKVNLAVAKSLTPPRTYDLVFNDTYYIHIDKHTYEEVLSFIKSQKYPRDEKGRFVKRK